MVGILLGLIADWVLSDDFDHDMAVSSLPDHPDVWTDGSFVLISLLVFLLLGLGFLLIRLIVFAGVVGGVMLMVFDLILTRCIVEVFVQSLGHFNLFRGLRCGVLF